MVARRSDVATTTTDRIREASDRIEELARANGRPTTALRNDLGHVVDLPAASSRPLLVPSAENQDLDVAVAFRDSGIEIRDPTDSALRDFKARQINSAESVNAALDVYAKRNLVADGFVYAASLRANLGAPGVGYDGYGTWHGNVQGDGVDTSVTGGYVGSGGNMYAAVDINAGRSIGAALNVIDALGNVRNGGGSVPEVKTDVETIDPHDALAALAKLDYATWRYIGDFVSDGSGHGELRRFAGPMITSTFTDDPLLKTVIRYGAEDEPDTFDIQSLLGLVAAALPAVKGNLDEQLAALAPLQKVAQSLPSIVAHSDDVHEALQTGQEAIGRAVAAVEQAAQSLTASLGSIAQTAAQGYAAAAVANSKVTALEARVAALEARRVRTFRAAGNLPTLALNATLPVSCPWTSTAPSPLPAVDQCQVFVAAGSAVPTVTAVGASGVTVSLKATAALLPTAGAVQVFATTW